MGTISITGPTDGTTADAADINTPLNTIVNEINGNLDNANIKTGAAIATAKLADDAGVTAAKLASASVTPSKLATGATGAVVATSETTTSTSFADLTTTTDTVTVTIGANGIALVSIFAHLQGSSASGESAFVGFAVSGATTTAASDTTAIRYQPWTANAFGQHGATILVTGLAAGSTTFKMKYRVTAGTGTFLNRRIAVVPL